MLELIKVPPYDSCHPATNIFRAARLFFGERYVEVKKNVLDVYLRYCAKVLGSIQRRTVESAEQVNRRLYDEYNDASLSQ